jgi:hypothetical protein|tara:strand:+ start:134 stop:361 length:228 start_codon:yes stop_codon:yes gene_type:complete
MLNLEDVKIVKDNEDVIVLKVNGIDIVYRFDIDCLVECNDSSLDINDYFNENDFEYLEFELLDDYNENRYDWEVL